MRRADAADWVEHHLAVAPEPGSARLFYHTLVWQYLPAATRQRISAALKVAGETATRQTPLFHFGFEWDGRGEGGALSLTSWPGGKTFLLGRANFHGRWADWGKH